MERNDNSDKYEHISYYLLEELDNDYKGEECKNNVFDENNFFLFTKDKSGKLIENVYKRKNFRKKYDFIIVENNIPNNNISKIIKVNPAMGFLMPKKINYEEKIKESIGILNQNNNRNISSRIFKSPLVNYNFKVTNERGKSYDKRYEIMPINYNNFSNNNFQQPINYNNKNNINYSSGVCYNQYNNNGMFNKNPFQNAGNSIVYNNNNYYNMNNNQAFNNINRINNSINSNSFINNGNSFNNISQNQNGQNNGKNFNQDQNNSIYLFPKIGLNNIGSTCYMNATLQCLLHVSELTVYFLREYPNDKKNLNEKNKLIESHGQLSNAFYELVKGVCEDEYKIKKNLNIAKLHNSVDDSNYSGSHKGIDKAEPILSSSNTVISHSSFSPYNFKKTLGIYNPQFKKFEANDSKDLILYLMQTMHEELNYFGGNPSTNLSRPNQYDKVNTFMYFMNSYNALNFSIISNIFYGTYENATLCHKCNKLLFNYQKFEFISFGMFDYKNKVFDIYNGFEDNSKPQQLRGENKFYCNTCKNLEDAEITSKIIQPPNKLLINIDYGKNKAFKPSQVKFDEIIDITKYVCFDFGAPIRYKIMGVCTHLGSSGSYGHYIAYCKHRETGEWFNFNDSSCRKCYKDDIYGGSPYLLLYKKL
jgi:ubiquitin C-terminal hydrolase